MSMSFEKPPNAEALARIKELFGDHVVKDEKTLLFNSIDPKKYKHLTEVANIAGQPVTVETHGEGAIHTMADGTQYRVSRNGWTRINPS